MLHPGNNYSNLTIDLKAAAGILTGLGLKGEENMAATKEQVFEQVRDVLVDALGVDEEEVKGSATLMGDLGAESIDFLDIVFRLEKAFGIKIPREELFPVETLMNNHELVSHGKLTAKGLVELKSKLPHTDLSAFQNDPDIKKLGDLFTVDSIVNYITGKLNNR